MKKEILLPEVNSERWLSLEDLPNEEWRDVVGYESAYKVSNCGRIKSIGRYKFVGKDKILKESSNYGYMLVDLCMNNKTSIKRVHRLVATAFIDNPKNHPIINHKDENKANNCVENLEWCTNKHNSNWGSCRDKISKRIKYSGRNYCKYDTNGNLVKTYYSLTDITKDGYNYQQVLLCCHGKNNVCRGYVWRFEGDPFGLYKIKVKPKVYKYSINGKLIKIYDNMQQASKDNNLHINYFSYRHQHKNAGGMQIGNNVFSFKPL